MVAVVFFREKDSEAADFVDIAVWAKPEGQ